MRVVIIVGGRRLLQDPLLEAVQAVRAAGGHVSAITWFPIAPEIAATTSAHVELRALDAERRSRPPRTGITGIDRRLRSGHRRLARVRSGLRRRWDRLRRKAKLDGQAALVHRLVAADPRCRGLVAEADVVVAGDAASIRAVWWVSRRRPEVEAINGLVALRTYLTSRELPPAPVSVPRS